MVGVVRVIVPTAKEITSCILNLPGTILAVCGLTQKTANAFMHPALSIRLVVVRLVNNQEHHSKPDRPIILLSPDLCSTTTLSAHSR